MRAGMHRSGRWSAVLVTSFLLLGSGCDDNSSGSGGTGGGGGGSGGSSGCEADDATVIPIGGIFTLTAGGSASSQAANAEQIDVIVSEVNNHCGTVGDASGGASLEAITFDGHDSDTDTPGFATDLVTAGVAFMVGAGGSTPTVPAADVSVDAGVPFAAYFATADSLVGCTDAQLADAGVTKSEAPVFAPGECWDHGGFFFRTSSLSTVVGATAAQYAIETFTAPALTRAAVLYRDDTFGIPVRDVFEEKFTDAAAGRTVTTTVGYPGGAAKDDFKCLIADLVAANPELVVGVWRIGELKAFIEAYVEMQDVATHPLPAACDTWVAPSGFATLTFLHTGSVRSDYTDLSPGGIAVMDTQSTGLEPYWDPDSEGFQKWQAAYEAFNPDAEVTVHTQLRTYDALMILTLAMTQANDTDGAAIAAEIRSVSNPPGTTIYPGEFGKARELILAGEEIDYEGASGAVNVTETGSIASTPYVVWGVDATGTNEVLGAYDSVDP